MLDAAADGFDRGRDHVAPVGDGGRAEHHDELRALFQHLIDRLGHRPLLMRHAALGNDAGAGRRQARLGHPQCLLDHLGGKTGQQGRDHADLLDPVGRDANERLVGGRKRGLERSLARRERDDLHRRDHLAFDQRLERRQGRERDRLVDAVEPVDGVLLHHQHAGRFREQVGAAGEGAIDMHALPRHGLGDLSRGLVLGHVARFEPRHHDVLDAGRLQRRNLRGPDQRALLEHERALADGVDRGGAVGLPRRDRAELHVGCS